MQCSLAQHQISVGAHQMLLSELCVWRAALNLLPDAAWVHEQ